MEARTAPFTNPQSKPLACLPASQPASQPVNQSPARPAACLPTCLPSLDRQANERTNERPAEQRACRQRDTQTDRLTNGQRNFAALYRSDRRASRVAASFAAPNELQGCLSSRATTSFGAPLADRGFVRAWRIAAWLRGQQEIEAFGLEKPPATLPPVGTAPAALSASRSVSGGRSFLSTQIAITVYDVEGRRKTSPAIESAGRPASKPACLLACYTVAVRPRV